MDEQTIIGIDPGKDGAICEFGASIHFWDMPTIFSGVGGKRDYDVLTLASILREAKGRSSCPGARK